MMLNPLRLYAALGIFLVISGVIGIHLYHDRSIRKERDTAVSNLVSFKIQIAQETQKRNDEILTNQREADAKLKLVLENRADTLKMLNLANVDLNKLKKDLTDEKAIINHALASQLHPTGNSQGITLPKIPSTASSLAQGGDDSDRTIATLTTACQITTTDYNALWNSWTNNCAIYGCK